MYGLGIHTQGGASDANEYKIAYYQEISSSTGTITVPTGATILLNQLAGGADALVSTIDTVPTGDLPQTSGGVQVDVTSFDSSGNYVLSGTPSSYPVALIYWLKISGADYSNLTIANIIEENIPLLVDNIYTADGSLTSNRTVTGNGYDLTFDGGSVGNYDLSWNGLNLYINNGNGFYAVASVILHGSRGLYKGNNAYGQFNFLGASGGAPYINRDIADANPSLIVEQKNASSTGDIAQFKNSTGTVASITNDGGITASHDVTFNGGSAGSNVMTWDGNALKLSGTAERIAVGDINIHETRGMYRSSFIDGQFYFYGGAGWAPYINRDVADANPTLIVDNENAASTGDIAQFWNSTGAVAVFDNEGKLGIGTTSPAAKLDVSGSINHAGASYIVPATTSGASGATTVLTGATFDNATLIKASHDNVSTGNYTLELPAASSSTNRTIRIISDSSTDANHNIVIVPTSGDTLDGGTSGFTINRNYEGLMVWSDGTEWFVIQSKNV